MVHGYLSVICYTYNIIISFSYEILDIPYKGYILISSVSVKTVTDFSFTFLAVTDMSVLPNSQSVISFYNQLINSIVLER